MLPTYQLSSNFDHGSMPSKVDLDQVYNAH